MYCTVKIQTLLLTIFINACCRLLGEQVALDFSFSEVKTKEDKLSKVQ